MAAVPASHPSLLRKELSVTSFFYINENSGLSSLHKSGQRSPGAGAAPLPSPFAGSPEPPSRLCTRRSRRRRAPTQATETPGAPGSPRQRGAAGRGAPAASLLPSLSPARGGAPLLSRQAAVEGEAKFPCRSCLGELAGTLLPRGSQ